MFMALGSSLLGLVVLLVGAELVTRGGSRFAARLGVPPLVVGLTIVAVGTSAPELAVGIDAVLHGNGGLAVGNIAGTNVVNILLILGLSALLLPLRLRLQTLRVDLPAMMIAALAMLAMSLDGRFTRPEGALLVAGGVLYTLLVLRSVRRETRTMRRRSADGHGRDGGRGSLFVAFTALVAGIGVIVLGADWFVDGTVALARMWGVSDSFIGLTVVAIGTSAPEFVTTIVSTLRGQRDIAVGNLMGSSVYNIFVILGLTCLVPAAGIPVSPELVRVDIPVMVAVALLCAPVFYSNSRVSRLEGGLYVATYVGYLGYLLATRTGG